MEDCFHTNTPHGIQSQQIDIPETNIESDRPRCRCYCLGCKIFAIGGHWRRCSSQGTGTLQFRLESEGQAGGSQC